MISAKSYKKFSVIFFHFIIISAIITAGIFPYSQSAQAASYTFTQTNWSGGATANNSIHPTNQSNWNEYSSASTSISVINSGADLELASSTASTTQTTDTQFNNGTFSNATTTGSGSSASVKLSKALHINEYTIGASTTIASVTVSTTTFNFNGTWTITFSGTPNLARLFKNDKFTDSASKAWKVLSVAPSVYKIIVVDSEGNVPTVSAPATGSGTVGRWYASIYAWEEGRQGDITANGRNAIERGLPYYDGAADTTVVTIDGWTTDATHYIEIFVPYSERHRGKWDDNKYRLESAGDNWMIRIDEEYVRLDGLQMKQRTSGASNPHTIQVSGNTTNSDIRISNNIFDGSGFSGITDKAYAIDIYSASIANLRIWNNIFYNYNTGGTGQDWAVYLPASGGTAYVYNNTIYGTEFGIRDTTGAMIVTAKNNIYQSNGISGADGYSGTFDTASDYNISDIASDAPGANSINSTTTPFISTSTQDFHLDFRDGTGNPAMNAGTSTVSEIGFTSDIDGDTRSGTWDIGADDVGATLVMTHSIGTASRDFSTLQAWEDARDGNLTTRKVFRISGQSAAFSAGEVITGLTSNATGTYVIERATPSASETYMSLDGGAGTFQQSEVVQGGTSSATATLSVILTTAGTIEKGEAYKDSTFTAGVTINGSTVDANHYMWLTAEPGSRHTGVAGTGVKITNNFISIADSYSIVEWLDIERGASNWETGIALDYDAYYVVARNNIVHANNIGQASSFGLNNPGGTASDAGYAKIYNNFIYGFNTGIRFNDNNDSNYQLYYYNNTLYNNGTGFVNSGAGGTRSPVVRNNVSAGNTVAGFSVVNGDIWDSATSNNISSDATAPGTGSQTSVATSSVRFVSTASDFVDLHIMDGSVAKDAGADLSATFTSDIDSSYGPSTSSGQARPAGSAWDVGADEWFSSSPVYNSTGTFTSATIDFGNPVNFTTANFSRVLTSGGIGKAFGRNDTGTLGNGTSTGPETCGSYSCSKTPVIISNLNNLVAVDGSNGWGNNDYHSVGLLADGTVKAWGNNISGQLGDGTTATSTVPVTVSSISTAVAVAAGNQFSMALLANGTVKTWGDGGNGKLGDGASVDRLTPVTVCNTGASAGTCDANPLSNVVAIAAGEYFSLALISDGTVKSWGGNSSGQLGDGTTSARNTPVSVSGITNAVAIAAFDRTALAVLLDGTVKAWGLNSYAQLGINTTTGPEDCGGAACSKTPVLVCATSSTPGVCDTYLSNIIAVATGDNMAGALSSNGTVKTWGNNNSNQLGDGTGTQRLTPVTVCATGASAGTCDTNPLSNVVAIAAGEYHFLVILSDGTVKAWGDNSSGQLGDGTTLARNTPVSVSGITNAVAVGAGFNHSLVVTGGTRAMAAAKTSDSGWQDSDYRPLGNQVGMSATKAVFPPGFSGNRYLRYKAYLSTADSAFSPQMDDVTINYKNYATSSPFLISSPYNTISANNVLGKIAWTATTTSGTEIRAQMRSAPNSGGSPGTWSLWCGYNSCDDADYFSSSTNNVDLGASHPLKNGNNDQWLQYKVIFISNGANTPTLGNISLNYAVNAPPEFDSNYGANGITISQISDSADANWGKAIARYSARDPDTTSGTTNPGYATPSFEYRLNASSSWTSIAAAYLNSGATSSKAVAEVAYTATSTSIDASSTVAVWDARTQLGANTYSTTTQIRVTMNDNEIANNIGSSTSAVFVLDTKTPSSSLTIDSSVSNNLLTFNFSDDTNISYRLSTSTFIGATSTEVSWTDVSATSTNATTTFTLTGAPNEEIVYFQVKDIYGNTFSGSDIAPAIGSQNQNGINLRDISNTETGQWQEFLSWTPFIATSGAAFSSYQLYRSSDGTNYSQLTIINSSSTNYYTDSSVASSTTYYYKVRFVDTDGDISEFSAPVNDYVDGQGGTDITAPLISNVQSSEIQSNWAKIIWTTDEYSDSKVEYSASAGVFTSSVLVDTIVASTTPHTVYLTGLAPNTTYYYRVKSKDVVNNEAVDPTSGNGYSFATVGGPVITNVSCAETTDNSATIIWNTDKDSVSWVEYSINSSLASATTSPSIDFANSTSTLYQQKISLTGLSQGTTYYLRVKSRDSSNNITMDNNNGSFYQCRTTNDTKPPVISNILTPLITDVAAVILWTTDERSTSQVEYGVASASTGNYASITTRDNTLTISHITTLTGLTKLTKYYFRAKSYDMNADSQTAVSEEQDFTTADEKQTITVYVSSGGGGGPKAEEKDTTAPTITNIKAESTGAFEAIIGFETNEEALSFVEYGKTSGYGLSAGSSIYSRSHSLKLSGLKMGAEYHFKVKAVDKSGNSNYSEDQVFTTKYAAEALEDLITLENAAQFQEQLEGIIESVMPSLVPPVISNIEVKNIGENSATIEWRTNVPAYSSLDYTADKDYSIDKENSYIMEIGQTETKTKTHRFEIPSLSPSTLYHFQARSFSLPGVIGKSTDKTFVTKASLIKPEIARLGNTQVEVRWVTNSETSSFIGYRDLKTGKVGQVGDSNRIKNHSVLVENLLPDNSYELRAFGYDVNNIIFEGNPITVKTKKDVAPPVISNIKVDNALLPGRSDRLQTVVSWITNEPANSMVYFEEGVGIADTLANKTGQENEFTTDHIVIITTFRPSTAYRIKVASIDEARNVSVSPMRTILTPRSSESVIDVITRNLQESFGFLRKLRR